MSPGGARGTGERIAAARKLHRMTQAELAEAAAISVSLLRKIEQGTRPVTPGVWSSIARTLGLDSSVPANDARSAGSRVSAAIPHIRSALDCYDLPDDGPIPPLPDLRAATEKATVHRLAAQYTSLADTLPELIAELTRAAHSHTGHDQETAFGLLTLAYRAADAICDKFGYPDLPPARSSRCAGQPHDPVIRRSSGWPRTCVPRRFSRTSAPPQGSAHSMPRACRWLRPAPATHSPSTDLCTCAPASSPHALACPKLRNPIWPKRAMPAATSLTPCTAGPRSGLRACGYTR